jgi:hypothetical protein
MHALEAGMGAEPTLFGRKQTVCFRASGRGPPAAVRQPLTQADIQLTRYWPANPGTDDG